MSADKGNGNDHRSRSTARRPRSSPDTTILAAAKKVGIAIPALCDSELVEPYGACRVCSVEVDEGRRKRIVTACNYPLKQARGGGHAEQARARRPPPRPRDDARALAQREGRPGHGAARPGSTAARFVHPQRNESPHACILCGLCVRLCHEGVWHKVLAFEGRGDSRKVTMPYGKQPKECVGCMAVRQRSARRARSSSRTTRTTPPTPSASGAQAPSSRARSWCSTSSQCHMREVGTAHLAEIMNDYDLLPVHNYHFGAAPEDAQDRLRQVQRRSSRRASPTAARSAATWRAPRRWRATSCAPDPTRARRCWWTAPSTRPSPGCGSNIGIFEPWAIVEINYYCDQYGVDTISFGTLMAFVMECYEAGVLNEERTGGLDLSLRAAPTAPSRCCTRWRAARASASSPGRACAA